MHAKLKNLLVKINFYVSRLSFSQQQQKRSKFKLSLQKKNVETSTKFDKKMPLNFTGFQRTRKLL